MKLSPIPRKTARLTFVFTINKRAMLRIQQVFLLIFVGFVLSKYLLNQDRYLSFSIT